MGIGTGRCQDGVHIEALLLWPIVEMKMRLFGEMRGRNPDEESPPRYCAPTIMAFKRRIDLRQSLRQCEDRSVAYAAGAPDTSARTRPTSQQWSSTGGRGGGHAGT